MRDRRSDVMVLSLWTLVVMLQPTIGCRSLKSVSFALLGISFPATPGKRIHHAHCLPSYQLRLAYSPRTLENAS